jgi:hypothetical protein
MPRFSQIFHNVHHRLLILHYLPEIIKNLAGNAVLEQIIEEKHIQAIVAETPAIIAQFERLAVQAESLIRRGENPKKEITLRAIAGRLFRLMGTQNDQMTAIMPLATLWITDYFQISNRAESRLANLFLDLQKEIDKLPDGSDIPKRALIKFEAELTTLHDIQTLNKINALSISVSQTARPAITSQSSMAGRFPLITDRRRNRRVEPFDSGSPDLENGEDLQNTREHDSENITVEGLRPASPNPVLKENDSDESISSEVFLKMIGDLDPDDTSPFEWDSDGWNSDQEMV